MKILSIMRGLLMLCGFFCLGFVFTSSAISEDLLEQGKAVYNGAGACASCHGPQGAGDGPAAAALDPQPRSFTGGDFKFDTDGDGKAGTDQDIENIITYGAQKYGGSLMMVGRPDLSEGDRKALVAFVQSLKKK